MPYLKQRDRFTFLHPEMNKEQFTAGTLNYYFTLGAIEYLEAHGESYQTYNDIIGALEGAKLELYRRKIGPYEDTKVIENGDVYD